MRLYGSCERCQQSPPLPFRTSWDKHYMHMHKPKHKPSKRDRLQSKPWHRHLHTLWGLQLAQMLAFLCRVHQEACPWRLYPLQWVLYPGQTQGKHCFKAL